MVVGKLIFIRLPDNEIGGESSGTLVQQLMISMLPVGAGAAPDDRHGVNARPASRLRCTLLPLLSIISCCR